MNRYDINDRYLNKWIDRINEYENWNYVLMLSVNIKQLPRKYTLLIAVAYFYLRTIRLDSIVLHFEYLN